MGNFLSILRLTLKKHTYKKKECGNQRVSVSIMGHFSSIRFNIRLATLTKFVEFLKSSPVKAGSSEFYFPA